MGASPLARQSLQAIIATNPPSQPPDGAPRPQHLPPPYLMNLTGFFISQRKLNAFYPARIAYHKIPSISTLHRTYNLNNFLEKKIWS
jgi:hypothetical protein